MSIQIGSDHPRGMEREERKNEEDRVLSPSDPILLPTPLPDSISQEPALEVKKRIQLQTHRFTFGKECTKKLNEFAHLHQEDDRKLFQKAWSEWIQQPDIHSMIEEEIRLVKEQGFEGDVLDKMFKSTRYYYRKKPESTNPKEQKPRKKYERLDTEILEDIDNHILSQIKQKTRISSKSKSENLLLTIGAAPSESFENYCATHKDLFLARARVENPTQEITKDQLMNTIEKFKKTYKNRFYVLRQHLVL
jgi:hypothetical protein